MTGDHDGDGDQGLRPVRPSTGADAARFDDARLDGRPVLRIDGRDGQEPHDGAHRGNGERGNGDRLGRPRDTTIDGRVIEAVRSLVDSSGVRGLTVDAVAAEANVAKSTIYRRWNSKASLLVDALTELVGPYGELPDTGSLDGDLRGVISAEVAAFGTRPDARIAVIADALTERGAVERTIREALRSRARRRRVIFERAAARGELRSSVNVDRATEMVVGAVWIHVLTVGPPADTEAFVDGLVSTVRGGLSGADEPAGEQAGSTPA